MTKDNATIARILKENGYVTSWFGKNHNTPDLSISGRRVWVSSISMASWVAIRASGSRETCTATPRKFTPTMTIRITTWLPLWRTMRSTTCTTAGPFGVVLQVTDDGDGELVAADDTFALIGSGTEPPVADAGGPYSGAPGAPISFNGGGSNDPDGGALRYAWDFGDGEFASGVSPTHEYATIGTYDVTVTVVDDTGRADVATTEADIEEPPAPPPPPPPEDDSGCFIATAAYGSYLEPEVMTLRQFRDRWLLTNAPGRAFVDFYYQTSPPVADTIAANDGLRLLVRVLLTPVVYTVKYPLSSGAILLLFVAWRVRRRRPEVSTVATID